MYLIESPFCWYTCSCYPHITILMIGKAKTRTCDRSSTCYCPHVIFFTIEKAKTHTCNQLNIAVASTLAAAALAAGTPATGTTAAVLCFNFYKQKSKIKYLQLVWYIYNWHLQLLPLGYNFYKQKSQNWYLRPAWHTCSCCHCITVFMSRKVKTRIATADTTVARVTIFIIRKTKTSTCNGPDTLIAAAPTLWFLQDKKRKQICVTGLTDLQLLLLRYDFYKRKSENRYVRSAWHS